MQTSVNFRCYLKTKCMKNLKMLIFYIKIDFYRWKNIFLICYKVYSDRSDIDLSDPTIRIQNFHSVECYDEKIDEIATAKGA